MLNTPAVHGDCSSCASVHGSRGTVLGNPHELVCRPDSVLGHSRTFLPEQHEAAHRPRERLQRGVPLRVVDCNHWDALALRPGNKVLDCFVVVDVLVAVGHHRAALVPATLPNNVDRFRSERIRSANNRANVHVVLPVLNSNMEVVPAGIKVGHDSFHAPVAVLINHIAGVAVGQQVRIPVLASRPRARSARPRANSVWGLVVARYFTQHTSTLATALLTPYGMDMAALSSSPKTREGAPRPKPRLIFLLGPALVAGVAYLDPGNVASNMTAGARYGYLLVWVVLVGNAMAWLIQYFSAKLGVVTGQSLPQVLGERIRSPWGRRAYWVQAELVAMATDIAEIIGGALALWLLFGIDLVWGGLITGGISLLMLASQTRFGPRAFEWVIAGLIVVIAFGFTLGVWVAPPEFRDVLAGIQPRFDGAGSVLLAASILGATIMPHAIYAHSGLSRDRHRPNAAPSEINTATLLRAQRWDVTIAMLIAGTVNLAILVLAASALQGVEGTDSIEGAYAAIATTLGVGVATAFAFGLLASGLASSAVGAYAGSEIIGGLTRLNVSLLVRRLVTLIPAIALLAIGFDPTTALVLSQVVLSFGIPFALIPLLWLTSRREVVGEHRNSLPLVIAGGISVAAVITLNVVLLVLVFTGF